MPYSSATFSADHFGLLMWATIGGTFVFIGLIFETMADEMDEEFLGGWKPHRKLRWAGWFILMIGILIETVDGGIAANEGWQTRQIAVKSSPFSQPVSDISAFMEFEVNRTYLSDKNSDRILKSEWGRVYGGIALMFLFGTNITFTDVKGSGMLVADTYDRQADTWSKGSGQKSYREFTYWLNFHVRDWEKVQNKQIGMPVLTALDTYNQIKKVVIFFDFLPPQAELREGTVDVVINGTIHKKFDISPGIIPLCDSNRFPSIIATESVSNNLIQNANF